jgi:hypothetical protein
MVIHKIYRKSRVLRPSKKIEVEKDVEDDQVVEDDGFRMNMNCTSALINYLGISFLLLLPLLIS